MGTNLASQLLPQFKISSHEFWNRCVPEDANVQNTFRQWQKVVMACYGQNAKLYGIHDKCLSYGVLSMTHFLTVIKCVLPW